MQSNLRRYAPSYMQLAAKGPDHVTKQSEAGKRSKPQYKLLPKEAQLIPFSITTTGGLGVAARKLVMEMAQAASKHSRKDTYTARDDILTSISMALVRGNARCVRRGTSLLRHKATDGRAMALWRGRRRNTGRDNQRREYLASESGAY